MALARFLRAQVDASGKTLKVLAAEVGYSKTQIGVFLAGRVSDQGFVTAMVRATTVREPQLRERRLAEAVALLRAAQHPSPTVAAPTADPLAMELATARAQQVETYERLTRALEQQNQLHEAAGNSTKLVMVLLSMINKLERRITDLVGEADQLRTARADPAVLAQTQQQLTRAQQQEQRAQQELARAQEKQRQAEDLAAQVQARVDQLTDELDRLRAGAAEAGTATSGSIPGPQQSAVSADPVGDDIDQALARVVEVNDHDDDLLQRITSDLTPAHDDPAAVVQDKQPDNLPISPNAADNGSQASNDAVRTRRLNDALAKAHDQGEAGDPAGAAAALAELLPKLVRVLGPDHPRTFLTRHNLAYWRGEAGDPAAAVTALAELLPKLVRVQGPDHPNTLATRHNLAYWRGEAGDPAAAVTAFVEVLADRVRVQGPDHPRTLLTRHELARWQKIAQQAD